MSSEVIVDLKLRAQGIKGYLNCESFKMIFKFYNLQYVYETRPESVLLILVIQHTVYPFIRMSSVQFLPIQLSFITTVMHCNLNKMKLAVRRTEGILYLSQLMGF